MFGKPKIGMVPLFFFGLPRVSCYLLRTMGEPLLELRNTSKEYAGALVILQMISSGLNLLKVSTFATLSLWGMILILVMAVNNLVLQKKGARRG
jgi:hypothetical protein